jgi:hypothetical protein
MSIFTNSKAKLSEVILELNPTFYLYITQTVQLQNSIFFAVRASAADASFCGVFLAQIVGRSVG